MDSWYTVMKLVVVETEVMVDKEEMVENGDAREAVPALPGS